MTIKVCEIPAGYEIKKWGDISNLERWYQSQQGAYLDRRILLRYNPRMAPEAILVYYDGVRDAYTILEKVG